MKRKHGTIDLEAVRAVAQTHSPQELFAALIWQRRFNEFDGPEVVEDLADRPELWKSFLFAKPTYTNDESDLSLSGVIDILLAMANYRPVPEHSSIRFVAYPADTLHVLAENNDIIVPQLLDLGKKWRADAVEVLDSQHGGEEGNRQIFWPHRLRHGLRSTDFTTVVDAVIVSYWWD